ncbi:MAG: hypothetical protein HC938_07165 [Nitrospira sp.]|nr:hypothetical protein [Nitrospira sp.]
MHVDPHVCQRYSLNATPYSVQPLAVWIAPRLASDVVSEKLHFDLSGAPQTMLATFYAKALDFDPNHKGALEYQGELFVELGQVDKAKRNAKLEAAHIEVCVVCPLLSLAVSIQGLMSSQRRDVARYPAIRCR